LTEDLRESLVRFDDALEEHHVLRHDEDLARDHAGADARRDGSAHLLHPRHTRGSVTSASRRARFSRRRTWTYSTRRSTYDSNGGHVMPTSARSVAVFVEAYSTGVASVSMNARGLFAIRSRPGVRRSAFVRFAGMKPRGSFRPPACATSSKQRRTVSGAGSARWNVFPGAPG